jgi:TPR repeat protein
MSFRKLREANFSQPSPWPYYTICYILGKKGGIFYDGPSATRWLEEHFTVPKTEEVALKVYLFAQGVMREPFLYITSCEHSLSADMLYAGRAFDSHDDARIQEARRNFLTKRGGLPRFKMHFRDLITLLARTQLENPQDPHFLMLEASIYYAGTHSVEKNFARSSSLYEKALTLAPQNSTCLSRLGEMYQTGGFGLERNLKQAAQYLRRLYNMNPHDHELLVSLVKLYCDYKPHKALSLLRRSIRLNPESNVARQWLQKLSCDTTLTFQEPFFYIALDHPLRGNLQEATTGRVLRLSAGYRCQLTNRSLLELRNENFKANGFGYLIACIESQAGTLFYDGLAAVAYLEKQWVDPVRGAKCERLSLFIQGAPGEPFITMKSWEGAFSSEIKRAALAFSTKNSEEVHESRRIFLSEAMDYNIHRKDIIPLFETAIKHYPKNIGLPFLLANIYYMGSDTLEKNFSKAAALFTSILLLEPETTAALLRLGEIWRQGGWGIVKDVLKAEEFLLKAYGINPRSPLVLDSLIDLYLQNKEPKKVLNLLLEAQRKNPGNLLAINRLANLYAEGQGPFTQNFAQAKELYGEILKKEASNVDALLGLGKLLLYGDNFVGCDLIGAEALFKKAQEQEPDNDTPLVLLGTLYFHGGPGFSPNLLKARQCLERAIKINPQNKEVPALLGELLLCKTSEFAPNPPRARELLEKAVLITPASLPILYKLAKLYLEAPLGVEKNVHRACDLMEEAYRLAPKNPPIIETLSVALYEESCLERNLRQRVFLLRRIVAINPHHWQACANLGTLLLSGVPPSIAADESEAIDFFAKASRLHPLLVDHLLRLGQFYRNGGKTVGISFAKALTYFEEVLRQDPSNIVALFSVASLFFYGAKDLHEDWTRAASYFDKVLLYDEHNIHAKRCLAEMLRLGGHTLSASPEKSRSLFEDILHHDPYDCFARESLAMLLLESGNKNNDEVQKALNYINQAHTINSDDSFTKMLLAELDEAVYLQRNANFFASINVFFSATLIEIFHQDRRQSLRKLENSLDTIITSFSDLHIGPRADEKI